MWTITDDPVADNDSYQEWLEEQPKWDAPLCEWCGQPLDKDGDEYCIKTDAHEYICRECSEHMWEEKRSEWEKAHLRVIPWIERET